MRFNIYLSLLLLVFKLFRTEKIQCSWTESRGFPSSLQEVPTITLNCAQGRLTWKRPRGALSLNLEIPKLFRNTLVTERYLFCMRPVILPDSQQNVNVYRKESADLIPVTIGQQSCLLTYADHIDLFIETKTTNKPNSLVIYYTIARDTRVLEPQAIDILNRRIIEGLSGKEPSFCSCDDKDFLMAFCTSDFVFKGRPVKNQGGITTFETLHIIRKPLDYNEILSENRIKPSSLKENEVNLPISCPVNINTEYLVVGLSHLGQLRIVCLRDWRMFEKEIVTLRIKSPCQIDVL